MSNKNMMIGALVVTIAAAGYLYYKLHTLQGQVNTGTAVPTPAKA